MENTSHPLAFQATDSTTVQEWTKACLHFFKGHAQCDYMASYYSLKIFLTAKLIREKDREEVLDAVIKLHEHWYLRYLYDWRNFKHEHDRDHWFQIRDCNSYHEKVLTDKLPVRSVVDRLAIVESRKALTTYKFGTQFTLQAACKNTILTCLPIEKQNSEGRKLINELHLPQPLKQIMIKGLSQGLDSANCRIYQRLCYFAKCYLPDNRYYDSDSE